MEKKNPGEMVFADAYHKHRLISGVLIVLFTVAAFLVMKTINEIKASPYIGRDLSLENSIQVSGEGEEFAIPDIAEFSFSVMDEAKMVADAQKNVTEKASDVLVFLKEQGVEERDIKTTGYNIHPKYEYPRGVTYGPEGYPTPGKQELVGYEVIHTMSVKVRKVEKAGNLLGGLGTIGVSNASGISFTVDDDEAIARKAREEAIADAREKAAILAKDLGVRLGRIVSFTESGNWPIYARFGKEAVGASLDASAPAPELPVGENRIVSNVTITYEIQ